MISPESLQPNYAQYRRKKILQLTFLVFNLAVYSGLIPLLLNTRDKLALYSVSFIIGYNVCESFFIFCLKGYSWPCTLFFRILMTMHDTSYGIFYALCASGSSGTKFEASTSSLLFLAACIEVLILIQLPKLGCCYKHSNARQHLFVMNGQTYQL